MSCILCDKRRTREGKTWLLGQPCDICDDTGTDYIGRSCRHCGQSEDKMTAEDMEPECIHIPGVPASQCTICNGREKLVARQVSETEVRIFRAKWPGHCRECNLPIQEGQMIAWTEGAPVMHEECYEDES